MPLGFEVIDGSQERLALLVRYREEFWDFIGLWFTLVIASCVLVTTTVTRGFVVDRRWQNSDRQLLSSVPIHNCFADRYSDRIVRRNSVCVIYVERGIQKTKGKVEMTCRRDLSKICWKEMMWRYCGSCGIGYDSIFRQCVTFWDELVFDVWLIVHRSSVWIKKPTRCHLVLYLFLLYKLLFISCSTWKNTTKSSAPEDGHKVARNMLSNLERATYKGEINIILSDI